jgi:hypothetical protein
VYELHRCIDINPFGPVQCGRGQPGNRCLSA